MQLNRAYIEEKLRDIVHKIVKDFRPDKVILFGSWAWGKPGPESDVDLLVIKDTKSTRELARRIDGSIFPRPFPIDLIVCRPRQIEERRKFGDTFAGELLSRGRVLYAK